MLTINDLATISWKSFNAEDSWMPLALSLAFWASSWLFYRVISGNDFARWYTIHTLHHTIALILGCTSLYISDNTIFHERIGIFWSQAYFAVDIIDSTMIGHTAYILHAVICLGLGLCNYNIPLLMELRMNSKAVFIETSSILLNLVKQNRNPALFVMFAVTFTVCRIFWIPVMGKELLDAGLRWTDPIILALVAFYGLQVHWWIKILKILWKGGNDEDKKSEIKKSNDEGKKDN